MTKPEKVNLEELTMDQKIAMQTALALMAMAKALERVALATENANFVPQFIKLVDTIDKHWRIQNNIIENEEQGE